MKPGRKTSNPEPLSEHEKRHFSSYEKQPLGYLLHKRPKGRTYFNSDSFALAAGQHVSENGVIETGYEHPYREIISHSNQPVPSHKNAGYNANNDLDRRGVIPERKSLRHQADNKPGDLYHGNNGVKAISQSSQEAQ